MPINKEQPKPKEISEFGLPVLRKYSLEKAGIRVEECGIENEDWEKTLSDQEKKFLEIGGPTLVPVEGDILDFGEFLDKTVCTNISKDFMVRNREGEFEDAKDHIDVITDVENLAFADGAFGAVFLRNFRISQEKRSRPKPTRGNFDTENNEYIRKVAAEVRRVLDDDGLLVWLNLERPAFKSLIDKGFDPVFYQKREFENSTERYQGVFKKRKEQ